MTIKYSDLTLGQIEAIGNKLGGMTGINRFLAGELAVVEVEPKAPKPRLIFLKTVALVSADIKKTSACLVGDIYGYRDSDIDRWLPKQQLACEAGNVNVYATGQEITFAQMFCAALKLDDVPLDHIAELLKARGHTLTLQQIDQLIEKQERGEDMRLRTDGWANFFPVVDADGSVSVVRMIRLGGRWRRYARGLGHGNVWYAGNRVVLSNSDPSNL